MSVLGIVIPYDLRRFWAAPVHYPTTLAGGRVHPRVLEDIPSEAWPPYGKSYISPSRGRMSGRRRNSVSTFGEEVRSRRTRFVRPHLKMLGHAWPLQVKLPGLDNSALLINNTWKAPETRWGRVTQQGPDGTHSGQTIQRQREDVVGLMEM